MTVTPENHRIQSLTSFDDDTSPRPCLAQMDEIDHPRVRLFPEDSVSLASSAAEPINLEDDHYTMLQSDLEGDAQDLEAESWSVVVDQSYLKALPKEAIKRQDVIYELIQTEMHHVRTLKILLYVYMYELRESLQMDDARLERLFPGLSVLLALHQHFLSCLKTRRQQNLEADNSTNYQITQIGDILISQFSGDMGERMKEYYGFFCSHHSDAVSFYKDQLQNNKKFQNLIKKMGQLSIVRRMGIPECFLLVTQRITKYPVLVERIIQNTEADTEEYESLVQALALIKETLTQVDGQVSSHEKAMRLRDISLRLEPKSPGRLKDGRLFHREDLIQGHRMLLHEATVTWKAPSGRSKEIHAVLLSDVLLLLQEKDQKLVFAVMDNKPPVISLQKLIVREVAHEDKAMFLICASSRMPEMYEIHTSSKMDRDTWMTLVREAVDSCPEEEKELYEEQEARLREFQQHITARDAQIVQSLTEKLQIFAAFTEALTGQETPHTGLLLRGDTSDLQQGEMLLKGAITEVENLQNLLLSQMGDPDLPVEESQEEGTPLKRAETFAGFDGNISTSPLNNGGVSSDEGRPLESSQRAASDPQLQELDASEGVELSADDDTPIAYGSQTHAPFPKTEFFDKVLMLSRRLYSLQAIVVQQDSQMELQRALLAERDRPSRHRGNVLLEQEKQRNLEKHKEELANFHKLQAQHRQAQQRWEKERERQRVEAQTLEAQLLQREEECQKLEARLAEERAELERQRETYQQDLERLRVATQTVEKERLEQQQKFKKHKTIANSGNLNYDEPAQFFPMPHSQSFRGDIRSGGGSLILSPKPRIRPRIPITDPSEVPPTVPPRKESINPLPAKAEVPIHLISTTNQAHKPGAVQQQIPTKLAALGKGKEKTSKTKGSHQRTHSAASIDMSQVVPIRVTGKEGGSLRARRTASPQRIYHTDRFKPPGSISNVKPSQSFSAHRKSEDLPPEPPPFPKDVIKPEKERVIFL
ncbi:rho guanine nucleotide exchange factor 18a [Lampris incognitus]|uniref:rho guanine nucleotide exchange factor 18a n=1 Tax=Lampris incognitus TaxID=2546036 RepID=UPI0024B52D1F|nr:rho guanine nucleotide exchange factor 18a [Lampris incognitus]